MESKLPRPTSLSRLSVVSILLPPLELSVCSHIGLLVLFPSRPHTRSPSRRLVAINTAARAEVKAS